MENLGCTSLFGEDLENICTNETKAKKAQDILFMENVNSTCLYPCKFLASFNGKVDSFDYSERRQLLFYFRKFLQTTKVKCTYDELDLEAAVGGFVGLFLGISIYQIKDGLAYIIRKINRFY